MSSQRQRAPSRARVRTAHEVRITSHESRIDYSPRRDYIATTNGYGLYLARRLNGCGLYLARQLNGCGLYLEPANYL